MAVLSIDSVEVVGVNVGLKIGIAQVDVTGSVVVGENIYDISVPPV